MKSLKVAFACVLTMLLVGCISPQSYLDPSKQKLSYTDIKKSQEPVPLKLTTVFLRNGEPYPRANPTLLDNSSRILRATGLIDPDGSNSVGTITITVNNIADTAAAAGKGFGTGLTLGLVGSTVNDNYELTMAISINDKTISKTGIQNGISTIIGNASIPAGAEALPTSLAFQKVLEQMILQALKDLQAEFNIPSATAITVTGNTKQKIQELQGLRKEGLINEQEFRRFKFEVQR